MVLGSPPDRCAEQRRVVVTVSHLSTEREAASPRTVTLLRTLNSIGRLSSSSTSVNAIAEFVTSAVSDVIGGDGCAVFLYDPAMDTVKLTAHLGFDGIDLTDVKFK